MFDRAKDPSLLRDADLMRPHWARQCVAVLTMSTVFLAGLVPTAKAASPIPQPVVDLGQTSFLDGEAGPGGLLEFIGNGYAAGYATDSHGHVVPAPTNSQLPGSRCIPPT